MPHVISLPGGDTAIILDPERDFRQLIDKYMGYDAADVFDSITKQVREDTEDRIYAKLEAANEEANPAESH